jgi:hypothetical protein
MTNQNMSDDRQETMNITEKSGSKGKSEFVDNNRERIDSEDDTTQMCGVRGTMCDANGVLCNSGDILESMFPYLSNKQNDDIKTETTPRDDRRMVHTSSNLTPSSQSIRRGRFLVWPAEFDCGPPLSACGPIAITSSSSGSE